MKHRVHGHGLAASSSKVSSFVSRDEELWLAMFCESLLRISWELGEAKAKATAQLQIKHAVIKRRGGEHIAVRDASAQSAMQITFLAASGMFQT